MKNTKRIAFLLVMASALMSVQVASAESPNLVKGVYDALVAEESDYSTSKALYTEYYPDMSFKEVFQENGFTITVSGNDYMNGSWTFVQDGDYLTTAVSALEYYGSMLVMQVAEAVGDYYGINSDLIGGYINGLTLLHIENDNFIVIPELDASQFRIYIAGLWNMKELEQMALNGNTLYGGPLDEEYKSMTANIGKLFMVANGNKEDITILLGEYGGLDDLAYQSVINVVKILQPKGWENFITDYTELADVKTDGYSVTLNADQVAVAEIIDDARGSYNHAIIHFGV